MFFYYTGSVDLDQPQPSPLSSLGGYKSSSRVPNDDYNNLFSDSGYSDEVDGAENVIGIVLKNELGATKTNITLFVDVDVADTTKYYVAAVTMPQGIMETINSTTSKPYLGAFVDITGVANRATLSASLENGGLIGLWIKRVIPKKESTTCDALYQNFLQNGVEDDESLMASTFVLGWD